MAIKLYTDSCCDLSKEMAEKYDVSVIPLLFTMEENEYPDDFGQSMTIKTFYDKVRGGSMPFTTLINTQRYLDDFTKELEAGNDVLYLSFSSGLSGSYQCSVSAISELEEKFKDRKIKVIDSKCASFGEGLFIHYVSNKLKEGTSFEDLYDYACKVAPTICHLFTVDDLNHLKRGGRVSTVAAAVGTALSIKPVLHVDDEGHLIPIGKSRGRKKALKELVNLMKQKVSADTNQVVFISHGDCIDDAQFVGNLVKETFENVSQVEYSYIGPVVGAHAGPGTVALYFVGQPR